MTADLYRALKISPRPIIRNAPAPANGDFVYVMTHFDRLENYRYFSVNHQSTSGDGGWQSERIYRREEADLAAEVLASFLEAEVIE
jgi:hypothetical protein